MTLDEALLYLRRYQDWRKGLDVRPMTDSEIKPKQVTEAIDTILEANNMGTPLIVCDEHCPSYSAEYDMCTDPKNCKQQPVKE